MTICLLIYQLWWCIQMGYSPVTHTHYTSVSWWDTALQHTLYQCIQMSYSPVTHTTPVYPDGIQPHHTHYTSVSRWHRTLSCTLHQCIQMGCSPTTHTTPLYPDGIQSLSHTTPMYPDRIQPCHTHYTSVSRWDTSPATHTLYQCIQIIYSPVTHTTPMYPDRIQPCHTHYTSVSRSHTALSHTLYQCIQMGYKPCHTHYTSVTKWHTYFTCVVWHTMLVYSLGYLYYLSHTMHPCIHRHSYICTSWPCQYRLQSSDKDGLHTH